MRAWLSLIVVLLLAGLLSVPAPALAASCSRFSVSGTPQSYTLTPSSSIWLYSGSPIDITGPSESATLSTPGEGFTPTGTGTYSIVSSGTSSYDLCFSGETTPTPPPPTSTPTSTPTLAPTDTPTSTPAPTNTPTTSPTAIPTVALEMSQIITTSRQLALSQVEAWNLSSDTAPLFLGLATLVFVFGLPLFVKEVITWRVFRD